MKNNIIRYEKECQMLGKLAEKQLNLPKNYIKENFESMSIHLIFMKITEEFNELKEEVMYKKTRNYTRISEELGDLAGCCAGLLAWVNWQREKEAEENEIKK